MSDLTDSPRSKGKSIHYKTAIRYDFRRTFGQARMATGERNIHLHTVLHLNKGDDNARGYIGTDLNNKEENILQVTNDSIDVGHSVVVPAIIRSKPFDKFAFRLTEQADGICLPEVNVTYVEDTKTAKHFFLSRANRRAAPRGIKGKLPSG